MTNTRYSGEVNPAPQGHNAPPSSFDVQRAKNDIWAQIVIRCAILENALDDARLHSTHRAIISHISRSIKRADGTGGLDRVELCEQLGINRDTLRKRIYELVRWGYLVTDNTRAVQRADEFMFGDAACDIGKAIQRWHTLEREIIEYCGHVQPYPPASTTVPAHVHNRTCIDPQPYLYTSTTVPVSVHDEVPHDIQHEPPTLSLNILDKSNMGPEAPSEGAPTTKNIIRSAPATEDLFADSDPPPAVEVKFWKAGVAFKPLGHNKFEVISDKWIARHTDDLEAGRAFVAAEVEQFFAEPPVGSDGRPIRLMGFITSGFAHRFAGYCARRKAGTAHDDAGLSAEARRQLSIIRHL